MGFRRGGAVALVCLGMAGQALAQGQPDLAIPVLVYNYANVPADTLHSAERQASSIFEEAGVTFDWHECRIALSAPQRDPYCSRGLRPADLVLKVLPQSRARAFGVPADVAGLVPPGEMVSDAFVFYDRLRDIARRESADEALLLGFIIAHELGHLLIGSQNHSAGGVMRQEWTEQALAGATLRAVEFSPQERLQIRWGALARNHREGTERLARSASPAPGTPGSP